jgi:glycosyltransferase involved in cell wall biosynthesis
MHSDLQRHPKKLLVVSDTAMQYTDNGVKAFGPVVKELRYLLEEFDDITWIGFERIEKNNSLVLIKNKKIHPILLDNAGGNTLKDKLNILAAYPKMYRVIINEVKKHQYIHSRAPSNPSVIVMFLSLFFIKKQFWHKYAGSWIDQASFFYHLQRIILKKLRHNSKITINGDYNISNKNIIPFENPCLDQNDRKLGRNVVAAKKLKKIVEFCFVGALNNHKGVDKILEALKCLDSKDIKYIFHFVGDGPQRIDFEKTAKLLRLEIIFHGFLAKDAISNIYSRCDFIILPSKSEGFPKVIGEAMNFGCIPIVSDVSCISQYIQDGINGFLIKPITSKEILKKINLALNLTYSERLKIKKYNFKLAEKFTYDYYNNRIMNEIFKLKSK